MCFAFYNLLLGSLFNDYTSLFYVDKGFTEKVCVIFILFIYLFIHLAHQVRLQ